MKASLSQGEKLGQTVAIKEMGLLLLCWMHFCEGHEVLLLIVNPFM